MDHPEGLDSGLLSLADFFSSDQPGLFAKTTPMLAFIDDLRSKGTYSYRRIMGGACNAQSLVVDAATQDPRPMVMLAANNYLGLSTRPDVIQAAQEALLQFGTGMCGAPLLNGTFSLITELEKQLAAFCRMEDAIVFSTGYATNLGAITGLLRSGDLVLYDHLSHASIIDGCMLSHAACRSYRHNDMSHLDRLLTQNRPKYANVLIVTDGVFSMDGDLADLPGIVRVAREHDARVMVDEAHAIGVLGPNGGGTVDHFDLHGQVDLIMGTFSKSLASTGGFIASSHEVVNYLRHYARSYFFSASPTPSTIGTVLRTLSIVRDEPELRQLLWDNVLYLHSRLVEAGFRVIPEHPESAILGIVVGGNSLLRKLGKRIHERGVYVNSVEYPAVAKDGGRLRLGVMASHTREQLDYAVSVLTDEFRALGIIEGGTNENSLDSSGTAG